MSVFLFSTYELDSSGAHSTDLRIGKVLDNIVDSLNDLYWQETLVKQIGYDKRKEEKLNYIYEFSERIELLRMR